STLFIVIMLLFFMPSLSLKNTNLIIPKTTNQIDYLAFSLDSVVADATADATFANNCSIAPQAQYDSNLSNYISNFLEDIPKSAVNCTVNTISTNLSGNEYSGNLEITCSAVSSNSEMTITKNFLFKKTITVDNSVPSYCRVIVKDSYQSNNTQVDLNQSRP
ncbi:MAG: hypothetical protein V1824_00500, partial [archaeon]